MQILTKKQIPLLAPHCLSC